MTSTTYIILLKMSSQKPYHPSMALLVIYPKKLNISVQFISVTQLYLTLCNPMNRSMPGLSVHHKLLEFYSTPCPLSQ